MLLGKLDLVKIGNRLRRVDHFIINILKVRLAHGGLSDYVAECKRKNSADGIFKKKRKKIETQRINLMKKWSKKEGIDPDFAASLMYQLITESCRVQDDIMVDRKRENKKNDIDEDNPEEIYKFQKHDLLRLTSNIARFYDDSYAKDFFGSNIYFKFEKELIGKLIANLEDRSLAIDLGCATGKISRFLKPEFDNVIGYDISPAMIKEARKQASKSEKDITFLELDLENGLNIQENSVSLAVMNMGTASEIKNIKKVLLNIKKALTPNGKFILSFYNSESIMAKIGFIPWPKQIAAHIDSEKNCLEVYYNNEIYFLYAQPRNIREIESLLENAGLVLDEKLTYPTFASIMPNIILENEDKDGNIEPNKEACQLIKKMDDELSSSSTNCGTYTIVTGGKK